MIVRKICQVEEDISHPGVLPIQDIELIGEDEISVEQIVVTGPLKEMAGIQGGLGMVHLVDEPIKVFRECNVVSAGNLRIITHDLKGGEHTRDRGQGVYIV